MAVTQETINKAKELNQQYKAWEITADEVRNQMTDAYYARDPNKLQNADVNVSKYGDDHTEQNYNNPDMRGWENNKYTGENTKNSYTAYDPNATTEWLNPNYQYWRNAQMANSEQANYIANRNDQIASALYNEWKTSIEDVANFLRTQRGFDNSTENERQNTIYSVWKRLGQIAQENWNKDTENSNWPTDQNNDQALQNMQDDLMKDTSGKLYWKVTADETEYGNAINTVSDPYNVDRMMAEARIANVKKLQTMDSQSIAASIISWTTPYGEQAMRDLMQYNPQKYEEIQTSIKQLKWQQTINSITSGEWDVSSVINTTSSDIATFAENNSNDMTSAWQILKDVRSTLESNTSASTAQEQMATIEWDMARLQNRLKNLDKEASKVFKWDVPQYIVNAYISNRTAEINDELSILENRYNAAYNRYKTELANTQWEKEYALKVEQLKIQQEQSTINNWATQQWIALKWAELKWTNLTQEQIVQTFNDFVNTYTEWMDLWPTAWQCWAFVKSYLSSIWINLPNMSSLESKMSLIDGSITEPTEWDIVIMSSPTHPENWHMAIVSSIDDDWTIHLLEANWNDDHKVHTTRTVKPWDKSILWYYRPQATTAGRDASLDTLNWYWVKYDLQKYSWWNNLSDEEKALVQWLLTYNIDPTSLPKTWDNWKINAKVRAAAMAIGKDQWYSENKYKLVYNQQKKRDDSQSPWGISSANSTAANILKSVYDSFENFNEYDINAVNSWINLFKKETWDPTVWAMYTDLRVAASEIAKALKWNASATTEEIKDIYSLLNGKMSNEQAQEVFKHFAKNLVEKNASEAKNYTRIVWHKPDSIYLDEVNEWMSDLWIDISEYYNYWVQRNDIPNWWNGWSVDDEINDILGA